MGPLGQTDAQSDEATGAGLIRRNDGADPRESMVLAFDKFELDAERFELRQDGTPVSTHRQVFELLLFLAQNPKRLITREELLEAIWKGRVVGDASLSTLIKAARQALSYDGKTQKYIRTAHGRGFEFLAAVSRGSGALPDQI